MKKSFFRFSAVFIFIFILTTIGYTSEANIKVKATKMSMVIGNELTQADTYVINGTSYLRLRDIANLLKYTDMAFDIKWDSKTGGTKLILNEEYESNFNYDYLDSSKSKTAIPNEMSLMVDGKSHSLYTYMIDDNNYIKLRDIIPMVGGEIHWEEETSTVYIISPSSSKTLKTVDLGQNKGDNKLYSTDYTLYIGQNPVKGVYKIGDRLYFSFENLQFNPALNKVARIMENRLNGDSYEALRFSPEQLNYQKKVLVPPKSFIENPYVGIVRPMKRYLIVTNDLNQKSIVKNALYVLDEHLSLVDLKAIEEVVDVRYDHGKRAIYILEDIQPKGSIQVEEDLLNDTLKSFNLLGKSNLQKVEMIHDYIVKELEYNTSYYSDNTKDAIRTGNARNKANERFKFVNNVTLTSKTGVCEDYAFLLQEMCTRVGIPATFQDGYAGDGGHLWNRIYFGNKWRVVDATWDDPVTSSKNDDFISREYFDPSLEKLYRTHSWIGSDYYMPEYDKSWQNLINQVADTPDVFRKIVIANLKTQNTNFVVKIKDNTANGGVGFLNHYFKKGDINYYTLYMMYDKKANGYRFIVEYPTMFPDI